ncbi:MAG TPA: DUF697 domain-containing protein [Nostocaceae cyanobacterium]|nr:DUF697 domain-containing protein [Nostocaceae cyanobacterium]
MKLQRPILVGGLGLTASLWILDSWHDSIVHVGEMALLSALAVGGGLWLIKKNRLVGNLDDGEGMLVDRAKVEKAIAQIETIINYLAQEAATHPALASLREQVANLQLELDRKEINVAVTGGKSTGKSTVVELYKQVEGVKFWETAPLLTELNEKSDTAIVAEMQKSDLVLFLTNGDLTDSELQVLQQIKNQKQPVVLVLNKHDQYLPDERATILHSLQQRVETAIAISASPAPMKVRKHQEDGTVQEWMEKPASDVDKLTQQLGASIINQETQLVLATTYRQAKVLKAEAKNWLNGVRGDRSTPIIEQYQWIAAAAAFANPIPALDILATVAINAQMVVDLGKIYQQKLSLEQAQTVATTMGSLMLKLGLVELSTRMVTGILKTHVATYLAGGVVEGISAAYLTRVAGLSLVEYFQQQEIALDSANGLNLDALRQTLQNVFQQNQQVAFVQSFVKQGVKRLLPENQPVEAA